ncbi:MAG: phage tail protein [Oceanobacter sp.]|jgi:microcystin-dependent protein|nr:MAG: phage tail protein [Oceanobacter sp.]
MSEPFIGEIRIMGCNFAPRGWATCDGQLLPISQNTALFSLLGTVYGGDGRSTFGLPNLQGRAAMHPGRGPGLTARRLGEVTGVASVSLSEAQLPAHKHIVNGVQGARDSGSPAPTKMMAADAGTTGDNVVYVEASETVNTTMAAEALSTTGGGQPHENRQPMIGMNYCIALVGLYPSRS